MMNFRSKLPALICVAIVVSGTIPCRNPGFTSQPPAETDLSSKFDFVEIWDVQGRSRNDFLKTITNYPAGICEQSLVQMGHSDGNKFPLPSGKLLLTTRSAPDYKRSAYYQKLISRRIKIDQDKWRLLDNPALRTTEAQLLAVFLSSLRNNHQTAFDSLFQKQSDEFATYGIKLNANKIRDAFQLYQKGVDGLSKEETLAVLYLSDDEALLRSASFILANYLNSPDDLVDALPLLLRKNVSVQAAIESSLKDFQGTIHWEMHADFLPSLLNNPNPFTSLLVLRILERTGVTDEILKQCTRNPVQTFDEILSSEVLVEEKHYLSQFFERHGLVSQTKP